MEKELGKDIKSGEQRIAYLRDNCDKVEVKGYMRRFSPEELVSMKDYLSEVAIAENDVEERKKAVAEEFKLELTPIKEEKKILLRGLKNKAEFVDEECFKFVDLETRLVGYYNSEGDLIDSRSANADELQGNIFQLNRNAQ